MKKGLIFVAMVVLSLTGLVFWNVSDTKANDSQPLLKGVHPVVNDFNRLLGGIVDGKWRSREEVANLLKGGEVYQFYTQTKRLGEAQGPKAKEEFYISGDQGYFLNFNKFLPEKVFGISAAWNPLPRVPRVYSDQSDLESYLPW